MKYFIPLVLCISSGASANEDLLSTYINFDSTYIQNNHHNFSRLVSEDFKVTFNTKTRGMGKTSHTVTLKQILGGMKAMSQQAVTMLPATKSNSYIDSQDDKSFCAKTMLHYDKVIFQKNHAVAENRKVCFTKVQGKYLANAQEIDMYLSQM